jgi:hypothetical protein
MSNSEYRLIGRPAVSVVNGLGLYARSTQMACIAAVGSPSCTVLVACLRAAIAMASPTQANRNRFTNAGLGRRRNSECDWEGARA